MNASKPEGHFLWVLDLLGRGMFDTACVENVAKN